MVIRIITKNKLKGNGKMRELKFRAWHKGYNGIGKKMLYDEKPGDCLLWKNQGQPIKDVMQCIGLCDKNGKEIYEGDILIWSNPFVKGKWLVERTDGGWNPFIDEMTTDRSDRYIVIGNIYENFELFDTIFDKKEK